MHRLAGRLIAVEGIDQAGKQTVCKRLVDQLHSMDVRTECAGFPDYGTPIGQEIMRFLTGERNYPVRARQLLYVLNRWEREADLSRWQSDGSVVIVDRYTASGIAYGMAQGLDREWLSCLEQGLPEADLTIFLDIPPEESLSRKTIGRDAYESQIELLVMARRAYLELFDPASWKKIDAGRDRESVWSAVLAAVRDFAADVSPGSRAMDRDAGVGPGCA